jgi:hypothetical protein
MTYTRPTSKPHSPDIAGELPPTARGESKRLVCYKLKATTFICALILAATVSVRAQVDLSPGQTVADHATLGNSDVVEMVKVGLSENVVLAKIRACACRFDTSTTALSHLKTSGVPDSIVVAMIEVSSVSPGAAANTSTAEPTESNSSENDAPPTAGTAGPEPNSVRAAGVLFMAQRTSAHIQYSSRGVFQAIVDDLLLFLRSNRVPLANDAANQPVLTEDAVSVYSLTAVAKNVGASALLLVIVDRPLSKWVKVSVMCYEPSGGLLWEEKAQAGGGITSKKQIEKSLRRLEKQVLIRIDASKLTMGSAQ